MEKKIATAVNVRINVGNYQHIEITKYAEQSISYDSEKEMIKKEDDLTQGLVSDIIRSMRSIPERLGKKTDAVENLEESVKKEIPRWLTEGPEPNLASTKANLAEKKHQEALSENKSQLDNSKKNSASTDIEEVLRQEENKESNEIQTSKTEDDSIDIFSEDGGDDDSFLK